MHHRRVELGAAKSKPFCQRVDVTADVLREMDLFIADSALKRGDYVMRRWLVLIILAAPELLHGQAPDQKPVAFEVASVKPSSLGLPVSVACLLIGSFGQTRRC